MISEKDLNWIEEHWDKFFKDCERKCFDCGASGVELTVIVRGVVVCPKCLKSRGYEGTQDQR